MRERDVVNTFQTLELRARGLVRDAFVLHGTFVGIETADDKGHALVAAEIRGLSRCREGVEDKLERIRHGKTDDRRLRRALGRRRRLNREAVLAEKMKESRPKAHQRGAHASRKRRRCSGVGTRQRSAASW